MGILRRKRLQNRWVGGALVLMLIFFGRELPALASQVCLSAPPFAPAAPPVPAASPAAQSLQSPHSLAETSYVYLALILTPPQNSDPNPADRQVALDLYQQEYLPYINTPIDWTGDHASCDPGSTSTEFRQAVLRRINYFRQMAGVPAQVTFSADSNRKAQAAALMMSVNEALDHTPPASWTCYSDIGAEGAGSANLSWGTNGWNAISLYMRDPGDNNTALGHRRWILYPQTQVMGTGDIRAASGYPATNALVVFDDHMWEPRPPTRHEFVAWPPPGYVPLSVVYPRWSFAYAGADFDTATVEMASPTSGYPVTLFEPVYGYGENTLAWEPQGLNLADLTADTPITVQVRNVVINGQSRDFIYEVILFDPEP